MNSLRNSLTSWICSNYWPNNNWHKQNKLFREYSIWRRPSSLQILDHLFHCTSHCYPYTNGSIIKTSETLNGSYLKNMRNEEDLFFAGTWSFVALRLSEERHCYAPKLPVNFFTWKWSFLFQTSQVLTVALGSKDLSRFQQFVIKSFL